MERIRLPKKEEGVLFLLEKDDECLIETRVKSGSGFFGHNRIPGGIIEGNESPGQAVFREVFEEFGVIARKIIYLDTFNEVTLNGDYIKLHAFLVIDFAGNVQELEPQKSILSWVRVEDASECLDLASSKLVIELAKKI